MADQQRGANQPTWPLDPYQINVQYGASRGIARQTGADWFGPLDPLAPIAPADVAGRRFDFPAGYNLQMRPRALEPITFEQLQRFADSYDLLRIVIEARKNQVERLRWRIAPKEKNAKLGAGVQARIDTVTKFFSKPDGGITNWKTWIRGIVEDLLVIDAPTLYCQRTRAGKQHALVQLDGARIKRVIDDWGRTPMPFRDATGAMVYPPAFQHVLKGMPAVDYSVRDIIYRPRNVRASKVYGYSPVEQILATVQIALRRQLWQLDFYTEGSLPDALISAPDNWTPSQIKNYQDYWDSYFGDDISGMQKRRKVKFVPGGAGKVVQTKEPEQKSEFDEWLARIVCYAFQVPPQAFVKMMNRATADNQSSQSEEEGLEPTKEWIKELHDGIIADEFDSADLELVWVEEDEIDPVKAARLLESRLRTGVLTLNEARSALGLTPYSDPAADVPMALTPQGYVPIDASALVEAGPVK
jgi:hypothetical protein